MLRTLTQCPLDTRGSVDLCSVRLSVQWAVLGAGWAFSECCECDLSEVWVSVRCSASEYESNVLVEVDSARLGTQEPGNRKQRKTSNTCYTSLFYVCKTEHIHNMLVEAHATIIENAHSSRQC